MLLQRPAALGDETQGRDILRHWLAVRIPIRIRDLFAHAADAKPVAAETHHLIVETLAKIRNLGRYVEGVIEDAHPGWKPAFAIERKVRKVAGNRVDET